MGKGKALTGELCVSLCLRGVIDCIISHGGFFHKCLKLIQSASLKFHFETCMCSENQQHQSGFEITEHEIEFSQH